MTGMKKWTAALLAGALALSLAACGGGDDAGKKQTTTTPGTKAPVADDGQVYEWKLGTIYNNPESGNAYNAFGESVEELCRLVEEKTGGRVKITPYYDSLLGGSGELYDQLRDGELEVFYGQPMSTVDGRFGMFSIPYLFTDYDEVNRLMGSPDAPLFQLAAQVVDETGGHLVASNESVFRGIYNSKKEIVTPDDVDGLTIRIYEDSLVQAFWGKLCSANIIPYSETFMALQTGIVDGVEHTPSAGATSYYEVCSHYTDINWQWTWGGPIIVSKDAWASLPEDLQQQVEEACWEMCQWYNTTWDQYEGEAVDAMAEKGIAVRHLTDAERQVWVDKAATMESDFEAIIGADFYNQCMDVINAARAQ